jgi:hypothetical protein
MGYRSGAAARFVESRLARGLATFTLAELMREAELSSVAARNQLLRLGTRVRRVTPRQPFYLIVTPEYRAIGAPPPAYWLDAYLRWLQRPYYLALQSAAAEYGSTTQAIQVTQVVTNVPHRDIVLGRLRIQFFVKQLAASTLTQMLPGAWAPLAVSTPEATALDLISYASRLGGIERAAETIVPMLPRFRRAHLAEALRAGVKTASAQRLGFILEQAGAAELANVVEKHLRGCGHRIALEPGRSANTSSAPAYSERWRVVANAAVEIHA